MGYGKVPKITLNKDHSITLYVRIFDFDEGTPVEISGQATQANGAVATFYRVLQMPASDATGATLVVPSVTAVPPNNFAAGFPITVVARATAAWITTLEADPEALASATENSDPPKAAWKENNANWAVSWPEQKVPAVWPSELTQPSSPAMRLTRHGTWWDRRKADRLDVVMGGRFTRLFPYLPSATFAQHDLERLAHEMTAPEDTGPETEPDPEENPGIPAAYTYLGQFVDHDLTFDPISHLRETLTGAQLRALVDFRTPRFDLDNLYGRGPDDQPYMYRKDGIRMLLGESMSGMPFDPGAVQLPRGPSGRALIGDPRNDENRIVAQLHAIFLRFHNRVVHKMGGKKHVSFREAREQVRWHYQWILVNDFLPRILEKQTYRSVFPDPYGPAPAIPRLRENDLELMPVEFSVAAYRFGHSMIRPRYSLNPTIERPIFSDHPGDDTADLGGFRRIPASWAIDWQFFVDLGRDAGRKPQLSYKIDTSLVHPLGHLPPQIATDPPCLALRNLERGMVFQLPSGQQVARALGVPPIPDDELMIGPATADGARKPITEVAPGLAGNAPLWAYILSEAQVMSWKNATGPVSDQTPVRLGPVGGRLVAEVFASLLRGDRTSYLYAEPRFTPIPDFTHNGTFGLAELINVVLGRVLDAGAR
ncbi:MAG: peroxidase family protein, partial [Isosphaeraceae bacterium]